MNLPPSEASHALVAAKVFFSWCVRHDYLDRSPCEGLRAPQSQASREQVLSDEELKSVLSQAVLEPYPWGPVLRLLVLTGLRRTNVAQLRWEYFDRAQRFITLPAEVTKNKRQHIFPYGDLTAAVLADLPRVGDHFFPASRSHVRGKPTTVFNGWPKAKAVFDAQLSNVAPYTLHDLRRTFASGLQRLGIRLEVIEQLLGHVSGSRAGVIGVYQRYDFLPEQRQAVQLWEEELQSLLAFLDSVTCPLVAFTVAPVLPLKKGQAPMNTVKLLVDWKGLKALGWPYSRASYMADDEERRVSSMLQAREAP